MKFRLTILLGITAVILPAQDKPENTIGWDKITWDMTIAEACEVYNVKCHPVFNAYWTNQDLGSVDIKGIKMDAQVGVHCRDEEISRVRLWFKSGPAKHPETANLQDFNRLKAILIEKYGNAIGEDKSNLYGIPGTTVFWSFPTTSITLTIEYAERLPEVGTITLRYQAAHTKRSNIPL